MEGLTLLAFLLVAQEPPAADRLQETVGALASDAFEGRNAGYPGSVKAAEYLRDRLKESGYDPRLQSFEFEVRFAGGTKLKTQNVIAWQEGTDGALKGEAVVVGAHYDHVGRNGQANAGRLRGRNAAPGDVIWNGADDNASGSALVLEIARALRAGKAGTKRSVLFVWFSAEEHGLLGSAHFVDHVPEPFKVVAMVNVDMVGRNPSRPLDVEGTGTSDAWDGLIDGALQGVDLKIKKGREVTDGSDHASFTARKIPAVHFFSGFHEDYHAQSDHADRLAYNRMGQIARFGLRLTEGLANGPARPEWKGPARPVEPRRLGITGGDSEEGGVAIDSVSPGSVAEKFGLQKGDVIVEFGGSALPKGESLAEMRRRIAAAKPGEEVPVAVLRDGGRVDLRLRW